MDVITCNYCQSSFHSHKLLLDHISEYHRLIDKFQCIITDCARAFSSHDSFRKHVLRKHASLVVENDKAAETLPEVPELFQDMREIATNAGEIIYSDESVANYSDDSEESVIYDSTDEDDLMGTFNTCNESVKKIVVKYTANLSRLKKIPRKYVTDIINETKGLFTEISTLFKEEIVSQIDDNNAEISQKLNKMFDDFSNSFTFMSTEQKRFTVYKTLDTFIKPISFHIGERGEYRNVNGVQTLVHVPVNAQFIPLRLVLPKFFQLPEVFNETMQYIERLKNNDEIITNFIQGSFWKGRMSTFKDKTVLPLIMYFDDYENNNPLGPHRGLSKTGAVYVSIPVLPPQYQAKLENIFVFLLFNTIDRKYFKNPIIFTKAMEELNFLNEHGIEIDLPCGRKTIYFELALFVGDNLGLHTILGLLESFNAKVFCQHCLIDQSERSTVFLEKECILRTVDNYERLLALNDPTVSGIKEECILHKVNNFHMSRNICVDVMHDVLEGICRYDLALILNHFIYDVKLFTLEELNSRIRGFDYGSGYNVNKPPELTENWIKNGCIVITSSEMLCLIHNLSLIIGHLIEEDDDYWQIYLLLRELVLIVSSDRVHPSTYELLETIIYEYLSLLATLFPDYLKPKHHFLLHYSRFMQLFGPLWKLCCMRFEGKNQEGKSVSQSTTSRVNINKTIAIKHQLTLNYRFMANEKKKSLFESKNHKPKPMHELKNYKEFRHLINESSVLSVKSVNFYDKKIKKSCMIVKFSSSGPLFHKVHEIIFHNSRHVFITKNLTDCFFNLHSQAFKIYDITKFTWDKIEEDDITNCVITNMVLLPDGYYYVSKRWL